MDVPCEVTLHGLPNKLLSGSMMEAVLQQAGFDVDASKILVKLGKPCGEATIAFPNREAAEQCLVHFQGCQWDQSGAEVSASIAGFTEEEMIMFSSAMGGGHFTEPSAMDAASQEVNILAYADLEATVPSAWEPGAVLKESKFDDAGAPASRTSGLSASAAAFVPSCRSTPDPGRKRAAGCSNTSTEVGESEAEDSQDTPPLFAMVDPF